MLRCSAETMPAVTVPPRPNGLPIATTQSPTRVRVESPKRTKGRAGSRLILSTAMSEAWSRPTTSASYSVRSASVTVICSTTASGRAGAIDVVVGDDIAVGRDDEARAERAAALGDRAAAAAAAAVGASPPKRRKNSSKPGGNCCWRTVMRLAWSRC